MNPATFRPFHLSGGVMSMSVTRAAGGPLLLALLVVSLSAAEPEEKGFISLWDGKTFDHWKANENKESWKIEEGTLVCQGPRSHLFYVGPEAPFTNFELRVD